MIPPIRKQDPERGIVRALLDVQPVCQRPCRMGVVQEPDKRTGGSRMRHAAATVDNAAGLSLALELR